MNDVAQNAALLAALVALMGALGAWVKAQATKDVTEANAEAKLTEAQALNQIANAKLTQAKALTEAATAQKLEAETEFIRGVTESGSYIVPSKAMLSLVEKMDRTGREMLSTARTAKSLSMPPPPPESDPFADRV